MSSRNKGFVMIYGLAIIGFAMTAMVILTMSVSTKFNTSAKFSLNTGLENAVISAKNWYELNYFKTGSEMTESQILPFMIKGIECEITVYPPEGGEIEVVINGENICKKRVFEF